jgi:sulfur relay protein TusB/DsrH
MENDLSYLYLFGFSPRRTRHLDTLLPVIAQQQQNGEKMGLVLLHDAVIGSTPPGATPQSLLQLVSMGVKVFALVPDLEARGMTQANLLPQISPLSYDLLADLLAEVPKVASWM